MAALSLAGVSLKILALEQFNTGDSTDNKQ